MARANAPHCSSKKREKPMLSIAEILHRVLAFAINNDAFRELVDEFPEETHMLMCVTRAVTHVQTRHITSPGKAKASGAFSAAHSGMPFCFCSHVHTLMSGDILRPGHRTEAELKRLPRSTRDPEGQPLNVPVASDCSKPARSEV